MGLRDRRRLEETLKISRNIFRSGPKLGFVAIIGLPSDLGSQVLGFLAVARAQPVRAPAAKNVSVQQIDHFQSTLRADAATPPDPTHLHVLRVTREIAGSTEGVGTLTEAIAKTLRHWDRITTQVSGMAGHPLFRPAVVQGQRVLPHQIEWNPALERRHWWTLSDERFTPYHFHTDDPQQTVIAPGGHQGFNLVNDKTERLVLVDWDARQVMNHTLILGLLLLSGDPGEFIDNFLVLSSDAGRFPMVERLTKALLQGKKDGLIEPGRHQFFAEVARRTGSLSLLSLLANYQDLFLRLKNGEPLTPRQRPNVEWLLRPGRFQTISRMVREGRIESFQANLFDLASLGRVLARLRRRGDKVSALYLSNAFDIHDRLVDRRHCFVNFAQVLAEIPFKENGRVLWTYLMAQNREFDRRRAAITERAGPPRILADPYDKYAYFEMAVPAARKWLAPVSLREFGIPSDIPKRERTELEAMIYYWRLGNLVLEWGEWKDGKWTLSPRPIKGRRTWAPSARRMSPAEALAKRYRMF